MIAWKAQTGTYQNGDDGYLGKYRLFSLIWDATLPGDRNNPYKLCCYLTGIKSVIGNFPDQDSGKMRAESVLKLWLRNTGIWEVIESAANAIDHGSWADMEVRNRLVVALDDFVRGREDVVGET